MRRGAFFAGSLFLAISSGFCASADAGALTKDIALSMKGYLYTNDAPNLFDEKSTAAAFAMKLDFDHRFNEYLALDFQAVGFANLLKNGVDTSIGRYFEGNRGGAFVNMANLRISYDDTTFTGGRMAIETPLFYGYDWLLAKGSFEAVSLRDTSFENVELFAAYVFRWRQNNTGDSWVDLTDVRGGNNWMLHAGYDKNRLKTSLWYYSIDYAGRGISRLWINPVNITDQDTYRQLYADVEYDMKGWQLFGEFAYTDYADRDIDDSVMAGVKAVVPWKGFQWTAAYQYTWHTPVGFIGMDTLFATSWNTFSSMSVGHNARLQVDRRFGPVTVSVNGAWYQYDQVESDGHEFDLILGWQAMKKLDLNLVFSNTDMTEIAGESDALEIFGTFRF